MRDNGMAPEDRPVDGTPPPVERWRSRPLRGLDELLDDLLGTAAGGRPDLAGHRNVPFGTE